MNPVKRVVCYGLLIALAIVSSLPMLLLVFNTFKTEAQFNVDPFGVPTQVTLTNVINAWIEGGYGRAYLNTAGVALVCILVVTFSAGLGGYALAKIKFRGSGTIMGYLLFSMSIPVGMFLVPLFFIWMKLHLMNSLAGLGIIYCGIFMSFNILLFRSYFVGIPSELRESALVDGTGEFGTFIRIFVPISRPVFLTSSLILAVWTWNEFFFSNAFLQSDSIKTVAIRYVSFTGKYTQDWSLISAGGLISILPILVLFLLLQRQFIQGIIEGSLKG